VYEGERERGREGERERVGEGERAGALLRKNSGGVGYLMSEMLHLTFQALHFKHFLIYYYMILNND